MKRAASVALVIVGAWVIACGASGADRGGGVECNAGDARPCACGESASGTQTCDATGSFGACACTDKGLATDPTPDASDGPHLCAAHDAGADGGPAAVKKCQICDFDVDPSAQTTCPLAPACGNGNLGAPAAPTLRPDLVVSTDNGNPVPVEGGSAPPPSAPRGTCLDPQLRIRMKKITVHKGGGSAYCIVEANDGVTSEGAVTMKTGDLSDGDDFPFPVGQGLVWGQGLPECTANNLTLSYYCFKVVDDSAWSSALAAFGDTAAKIGGSPAGSGPYGWAFGVAGAAANAAAAGISAAAKDENRIKVQQTIPVSGLLDLANGRTWSVRTKVKDGCGLFGCDRDYDWELTLEAWGCADKLPNPR